MKMSRACVGVCVVFGWLVAAAPTVLAKGDGGWCRTFENWAAKHPPQEGGSCAIEGDCDIPQVRDTWIPDDNTPMLVLRIHFVVFAEDDGSNPAGTPEEVELQLAQLNEDYLPSRMQFVATTDFVNSTQFRYFASNEEFEMKSTYAVDPDQRLNVFVVSTSGYSVGTFPWDPVALDFLGGIILHEGHFGPGRSILAHEVGHNVGLWHTHHGVSEVSACSACYELADGTNGDTTGDFAGDTPPTPVNFACGNPGGADTCSGTGWGETDFQNYMGYAPDGCYTHFTLHQRGRQQCWFNDVLTSWLCAECLDPGACCQEGAPGQFTCTEVLQDDCTGTFFGLGTRCDDLGPKADRCDCNQNGVADAVDIDESTSEDCNDNVVPDECEPDEDCNKNGTQDICDIAEGTEQDCNDNSVPDVCDIAGAASDDCDENDVPDECQPDCNGNAVADVCDIRDGTSSDADANGVPDECQRVIFVSAAAAGANDGSSWEHAFVQLSDALDDAHLGDSIHVAQGTYRPADAPIRTASFALLGGVGLYGGYAGPGTADPDTRDPRAYVTVLSGDLGGNDGPDFANRTENCFNVLTSFGHDHTTVVSGFTIRGGNANGSGLPYDAGGGMRIENGSPTLIDCTFESNSGVYGGGLECFNGADATLVRCVFRNNLATYRGGGMHVNGSSPTLDRCDFIHNEAENSGGGLRCLASPSPLLTHCRFYGNYAPFGGGMVNDETDAQLFGCLFTGNTADGTSAGMHNWISDPLLVGCTFSGNIAGGAGGGMFNLNTSRPTIESSILWGNRDQNGHVASSQIALNNPGETPFVSYSCIEGGWPNEDGVGNIGDDPLFLDADGGDNVYGTEDDDVRLFHESPGVDAGDPNADAGGVDLDGHPRVLCGQVDMGAYEYGIGDYNCDGRIDLMDFAEWSNCETGPNNGPVSDGCASFDDDADDDVDWTDFAGFQRSFVGECDVTITQQPAGVSLCSGAGTTLEVVAVGPVDEDLTYQWRRDGIDLPDETGVTLVIESATPADAGSYRCVVRAGCRGTAFSAAADVVVTDAPTEITTQPAGSTPCVGGAIFLFGNASNFPSYQWTKDSVPIPGATNAFLAIPNVTMEDSGTYNLIATNGCNSVTSNDAVVTVIDCLDQP